MLELMARRWWAVLLRGIIAIILGIVAFAMPRVTIGAFLFVFGVYVLLSGISSVIMAAQYRHDTERWWPLLARGAIEIILGALVVWHPVLSGVAFAVCIGIWAVIVGVLEMIASVSVLAGDWALLASGIVSVLLGLALIVFPAAGVIAVVWMIGFYALLFGAFHIWLAIRLERFNHRNHLTERSA